MKWRRAGADCYTAVALKILWLSPMFLHPTTRGGQIRSLQILRQLHRRHEIHYLALDWDEGREAMDRAVEYSTRAWAIAHPRPGRGSPRFAMQLAGNLVSPLPLAVSRFTSHAMRRKAEELIAAERYDRVVCDFLHAAQNTPGLDRAMLFQHNVETTIWERHAGSAPDPLRRWYFQRQAERMRRHEGEMCRLAGGVVAVSEIDAARMREMFAVSRVSTNPHRRRDWAVRTAPGGRAEGRLRFRRIDGLAGRAGWRRMVCPRNLPAGARRPSGSDVCHRRAQPIRRGPGIGARAGSDRDRDCARRASVAVRRRGFGGSAPHRGRDAAQDLRSDGRAASPSCPPRSAPRVWRSPTARTSSWPIPRAISRPRACGCSTKRASASGWQRLRGGW